MRAHGRLRRGRRAVVLRCFKARVGARWGSAGDHARGTRCQGVWRIDEILAAYEVGALACGPPQSSAHEGVVEGEHHIPGGVQCSILAPPLRRERHLILSSETRIPPLEGRA